MAFMMPVMKNNYEIYPAKCKTSSSSKKGGGSGCSSNRSSRPNSRTVSESEKGSMMSTVAVGVPRPFLTTSPPGRHPSPLSRSAPPPTTLALRPQRSVRFCRSASQEEQRVSRRSITSRTSVSSSTTSCSDNTSTLSSNAGSNSNVDVTSPKFGSLTRFHAKLVDSLKRKLKIKDVVDDVCTPDEDVAVIRAST